MEKAHLRRKAMIILMIVPTIVLLPSALSEGHVKMISLFYKQSQCNAKQQLPDTQFFQQLHLAITTLVHQPILLKYYHQEQLLSTSYN